MPAETENRSCSLDSLHRLDEYWIFTKTHVTAPFDTVRVSVVNAAASSAASVRPLDPYTARRGFLAHDFSGVRRTGRLDEHSPAFGLGRRLVLHGL